LKQAEKYGDPILEIGCGTGRISIPLAEAGFSVVGIDFATSMLAQARRKSARVEWLQEDIRTFNLDRKFACIFAPYYVFNYFHELENVEAVLKNCKTHLKPDGKLILDLAYLPPKFLRDLVEQERLVEIIREFVDPKTQEKILVKFEEKYDFKEQIHSELISYHFSSGKVVPDKLDHRIYFPKEIKAILKYNGFRIEQLFGDYDGTPFQVNSLRHILVCGHF